MVINLFNKKYVFLKAVSNIREWFNFDVLTVFFSVYSSSPLQISMYATESRIAYNKKA